MDHLSVFNALWSFAGKGLTSWFSCVMSNCGVVTLLPAFSDNRS